MADSHEYASDDYDSEPDAADAGDAGAPHTGASSATTPPDPPSRPSPSLLNTNVSFYGPPFYGRPPTPLLQTPSLTSLFRPSRPTTPDVSDDDDDAPHAHATTTTEDEHMAAPPAATTTATTTPPRVPTYEYYGFVLYVSSSLCFGAYLVWAFLPSPVLHALGIYYYPNRWWALAVPAFLVASVVYVYVALAAYNTEILAVRVASAEAMVDGAGKIADAGGSGGGGGSDYKTAWSVATDAVMDVPLAGVNEVLYGG
jgi:phosphatidylinositol glycan class P protein